jgi:23S rRNA maturation-related 3'-5' exoribonuclease YhaM
MERIREWLIVVLFIVGGIIYCVKDEETAKEDRLKKSFLDEIGELKGQLRDILNQAENIRREIVSKMYAQEARKKIVESVKLTPAQEILDECKKKEQETCVAPEVIKQSYAKFLEDERRLKYEQEVAKIQQQIQQQQQQQQKQQQQQNPPIGGGNTPPLTPPTS